MAGLDVVDLLVRQAAGGPHLAGAVACWLLLVAVQPVESTTTARGRDRGRSGRPRR